MKLKLRWKPQQKQELQRGRSKGGNIDMERTTNNGRILFSFAVYILFENVVFELLY